MSATFDAASDAGGFSGVSSISWTHTPVGTPDYVYVGCGSASLSGGTTISSPTYGGAALTSVKTQLNTNFDGGAVDGRASLYGLVAPASGAQTVSLTFSGTNFGDSGAATFIGVDQTTPTGTPSGVNVSNTPSSITISSATGNYVVDAIAVEDRATALTAGQTQVFNGGSGVGSYEGAGQRAVGSASVAMGWTWSSAGSASAQAAVEIKAAAGGGGSVGTLGIDIALAGTGKSTNAQPATSSIQIAAAGVGASTNAQPATSSIQIAVAGTGLSTSAQPATAGINIGVAGVGSSNAASVGTVGIAIAVAGVGTGSSPGQGVGSVGLNIDVAGTGISTNQQAGSAGINIDVAGVGQSNQTVSGAGTISLGIDVLGSPVGGVVQGGHFLPITKKELAAARKKAKAAREREEAGWDRAAKEKADLHKAIMATLHPEKILGVGKRETVEDDDDEADIEMLLLYG